MNLSGRIRPRHTSACKSFIEDDDINVKAHVMAVVEPVDTYDRLGGVKRRRRPFQLLGCNSRSGNLSHRTHPVDTCSVPRHFNLQKWSLATALATLC